MITVTSVLKVVGTVGAIGSMGWMFDVPNEVREYVSAPLRIEMKAIADAQTNNMASMKHYDMRTDELQHDVDKLSNKIARKKAYIKEHLQGALKPDSIRYKSMLEGELDSLRNEIEQKIRMLEKATDGDAMVLRRLSQA